jgi:hypothetical protein
MTTFFARVTAEASPAHAMTATITASHASLLRSARTNMTIPAVTVAAHEPSHVSAFIAELNAGVRCATTVDVM